MNGGFARSLTNERDTCSKASVGAGEKGRGGWGGGHMVRLTQESIKCYKCGNRSRPRTWKARIQTGIVWG